MRGAAAFALAMSASLLVLGPASAQRATTGSAPPLVAPAPALAPRAGGSPAHALRPPRPAPAPRRPRRRGRPPPNCDNPNALGVARTVEIDTTGGPGFGFEHFKQHDFLRDKEVVLTFDDGPWPTTPAVLKALADECVKATFFPIGKHATYYPEILRQVAAAGHSVGSHTWSHQDLSKQDRRRGQGRDREGHQRREMGARRSGPGRRRSSASRRCAIRRRSSPISASATSRSSRPTWTRSTSRCASPSRWSSRS